jgi:hypothetical protein
MNIKLIFILVFKYKYYNNIPAFPILMSLVTGSKTLYGKFRELKCVCTSLKTQLSWAILTIVAMLVVPETWN